VGMGKVVLSSTAGDTNGKTFWFNYSDRAAADQSLSVSAVLTKWDRLSAGLEIDNVAEFRVDYTASFGFLSN